VKIYIDTECKCHTTNPEGKYTEIEAPRQFEGKCDAYIEGYRVRPEGYTYTMDDGTVFGPNGSSVTPWKPYSELDNAQREYEKQLLAEYESALAEIEAALGV
jgi:hypothetical protein